MKKILITLISLLSISIIHAENSIEYPRYFGTKKCEIIDSKTHRESYKIYAKNYSDEQSKYYLQNGDLYKDNNLYKEDVKSVLFEMKGEIMYVKKSEDTGYDIFLGNNELVHVDEGDFRNTRYDKEIDRYYVEVWNEKKEYFFSNGELIPYKDFLFFRRHFSKNKIFYLDLYSSRKLTYLEQDGEKFFIDNWNIQDLRVGNDGSYSFLGYDIEENKSIFVINGLVQDVGNVIHFDYSPNGEDLYFIIKKGAKYDFYKNGEKFSRIVGVYGSNLRFNFIDNENFDMILNQGGDYVYIENGKEIIGINSEEQIKLKITKKNGDEYLVKRYKNKGKDIFYINGKKVLESDHIDERYLNGGIGTFSMFPNKQISNQYYTYITKDYDLVVNGYMIPHMYDYLRLENGLDNFNFFSKNNQIISCKDFNYLFPNHQYSREKLENILRKIHKLDQEEKEQLQKKLNLVINNSHSNKIKNLGKMIGDNLKYNVWDF